MRRWGLVLLIAVASCTVNPVPEPPARPEVTGPVDVDGCTSCDGTIFLHGSAKNAARIWAVNLDSTEPPEIADVSPDGSFVLGVHALEGQELRLQARSDEGRSDPMDFVVPAQGPLTPAPRPLAGCLTAAAELDLGAVGIDAPAASRAVTIDNACPDAVTAESIVLRAPSVDFAVTAPATPLAIAAGTQLTIDVGFDPTAAGDSEEILLVEISSPSADRRPVTLFGRGIP